MEVNFYDGLELGTFVGYAPETNSLCIDKETEDNRKCSTTGTTNILFPEINVIFCSLFFLLFQIAL